VSGYTLLRLLLLQTWVLTCCHLRSDTSAPCQVFLYYSLGLLQCNTLFGNQPSCIRSTERHADCSVSQTQHFDTGNKNNCINSPGFLSHRSIWPTLGGQPPPLRQPADLPNALKNSPWCPETTKYIPYNQDAKNLFFFDFASPNIESHYTRATMLSAKYLKKSQLPQQSETGQTQDCFCRLDP